MTTLTSSEGLTFKLTAPIKPIGWEYQILVTGKDGAEYELSFNTRTDYDNGMYADLETLCIKTGDIDGKPVYGDADSSLPDDIWDLIQEIEFDHDTGEITKPA